MPNRTPSDVGNKFIHRVDALLKDYKSLLLNIDGKKRQASLETLLAEQTVMSLGIYWEAFLHELVISYIVQSPGTCIADFRNRMNQSMSEKFAGAASWMTLNAPSSLTREQAELLLDPKGENVTATDPTKLAETANRWVSAGSAPKFSLNQEDAQFLTLLVSMRNFLAHRSVASRSKLRTATANLSGANAPLQAVIKQFATYIKHSSPAGSRVDQIASRSKQLAARLAL
jgi:hypothetical protein